MKQKLGDEQTGEKRVSMALQSLVLVPPASQLSGTVSPPPWILVTHFSKF